MSKLWNTLKSVVGTAAVQAEVVAPHITAATAADRSPTVDPVAPILASQAPGTGQLLGMSSVKPHIPMIKFRKGLEVPVAPAPVAAVLSAVAGAAGGSLEWWEVPAKFRREIIDEKECEAINMGGREVPWC
eukprot:GFUD01006839.1.p1 GENE.GFUD01006839.1~~GFUD01006839.1.p1  ORF type:complete len:131 (+),score=40.49 GFUD01006839.1:48-440(+)